VSKRFDNKTALLWRLIKMLCGQRRVDGTVRVDVIVVVVQWRLADDAPRAGGGDFLVQAADNATRAAGGIVVMHAVDG
jgi:hypothetical protein